MARHPDESGCVGCSKKLTHAHGESKPPCMEAHQYANAHGKTTLMVFDAKVIGGGPCAWSAELSELRPLMKSGNFMVHNPPYLLGGHSARVPPVIVQMMQEHAKSSVTWASSAHIKDELGYEVHNGQRAIKWDDGTQFLILIARPNDREWDKFNEEYKHKITNHGHYDRNVKYLLAIQEAAQMTPGEMGKFLKELTSGHNLAKAVLIFTLFAGGSALAMSVGGVARALAVIVGLGMDAAAFVSCAEKLVAFGTLIEKAETPQAITAAAHKLYEFCSELTGVLLPHAGSAVGAARALKERIASRLESWFVSSRARWKQASNPAQMKAVHAVALAPVIVRSHRPKVRIHPPPKPRLPDAEETAAGMWHWHLEGWQRLAQRRKILAVVRAGNPASLPHHFDIMVDGKPMLVKWKTAKEGPWNGLVVVPERNQKGEILKGIEKLELHECIVKLKKAGYTFKPPPKPPSGMPEPGALVINEKHQALCGDVDAMGVYPLNKEGKLASGDITKFNNSKGLQNNLNMHTYGVNSPTMGQHPGQDFFYYATDKTGQHTMGLQPDLKEKFVVFTPDGKHKVVDLTGLEEIYREHGIPWKYDAGQEKRRESRLEELQKKYGREPAKKK